MRRFEPVRMIKRSCKRTCKVAASPRGDPLPPLPLVQPHDPGNLVLQARLVAGGVAVEVDHLEVRERVHPTPVGHPELAPAQLGVVHVEDVAVAGVRRRSPVDARRALQPHDLGFVVGLVVVRRVHREDAVVFPNDYAVR